MSDMALSLANDPPESADPALRLARRLTEEVLSPLKTLFVGKDEVIDLLGVSLVAGENLFIHGPPGTAKSALVQELGRRLDGQTFEYLLTRFTEPNELFGPFDIRRLREGELVTNTQGMLPEASLAFLDELFNANSAILNSLLTVLNERLFRRGRETRQLPLLMAVGASNHLPEDDALRALFDRFLLRVHCDNVGPEELERVLEAGWRLDAAKRNGGTAPATLSLDDTRTLANSIGRVELDGLRQPLVDLVQRLRHAGIAISDRRAVKLQRPVAASALLAGRLRAQVSDLWVFRYIWETLEQREVIATLVGDVLAKAPDDAAAHPRARGDDRPNPESIARDLEHMAARLAAADLTAAQRAHLRDRLGVLAGRCEWVADQTQRDFLLQRVNKLLVGNGAST